MSEKALIAEVDQMNRAFSEDNVDVCPVCGNTYLTVMLIRGGNYNDFGDRYCPFCGFLSETLYRCQ